MYTITYMLISIFTEPPSMPVGPLSAMEILGQSITLQWQPPSHDGGSPLTAYIIEFRNAKRIGWNLVDQINPQATTYTVKNLTKNNDYYFRVFAENKIGISPPLESKPLTAKDKYGN